MRVRVRVRDSGVSRAGSGGQADMGGQCVVKHMVVRGERDERSFGRMRTCMWTSGTGIRLIRVRVEDGVRARARAIARGLAPSHESSQRVMLRTGRSREDLRQC